MKEPTQAFLEADVAALHGWRPAWHNFGMQMQHGMMMSCWQAGCLSGNDAMPTGLHWP